MSSTPPSLTVYGVPLSQPTRSVLWALLWKRVPFSFRVVSPGSRGKRGSRGAPFLAINPAGTVPAITVGGGFALGEAHAILTFLADSHGWEDLYPRGDRQRRAKIDEYLHFHHQATRQASTFFAMQVRKDLKFSANAVKAATSGLEKTIAILETGWLGDGRLYLAGGDTPSLADISCYAELGQLRPQYTNLQGDMFAQAPRLEAWMTRMESLPAHGVAHASLAALGDLSSGEVDMQRVVKATMAGVQAIKQHLAKL